MAFRVWTPPRQWEHYLSCLVMHIVAPFLPIGLEWLLTGSVDAKSLCLFVAMYAMAIGITSSSVLFFALTLLVGLIFTAAYGWLVKGNGDTPINGIAPWVLVAIVIIHALERFNRHVVDLAPFWEFKLFAASRLGAGTPPADGPST